MKANIMRKMSLIFLIMIFIVLMLTACNSTLPKVNSTQFKVNFIVDDADYATIETNGRGAIKMPDNPTKEGFSFGGWFTEIGGGGTEYTGAEAWDTPNDISLYAYWLGTSGLSYAISETTASVSAGTFNASAVYIQPYYQGKKVTTIEDNAFSSETGLTEIAIPNTVTSIGDYAFLNCSGLTEIIIPNRVTNIGNSAFYGCRSLTKMTIPFVGDTLNGTSNTYFGFFFGASSYSDNSSYVPSSLKTVIITGGNSIDNSAFQYCSGLTEIAIPSTVTSIGQYAFSGCSSLTKMTIPFVGNTLNGTSNTYFGFFFGASSYSSNSTYVPASLKTVIITGGNSIGDYAFRGCSGLTKITIPSRVTSIGNYAFEGCRGLTSISIPSSVTSTGNSAFDGCSSLTEITIPNSVKSIGGYAFRDCSSLTKITIPSSVTSIGYSAFSGCSGLTTFTIPSSVTSIGNSAFSGCSSLTKMTIPFVGDTLNGTSNTHFGYIFGAPNNWDNSSHVPTSLKTVIITGGNSIGSYAFQYCTGLTEITIPNSVTSIGEGAFSGCSGLIRITVQKGNTVYHSDGNCIIETASKTLISGCNNSVIPADGSVTSISNYAFSGCSGLTKITIPNSVTSIGKWAFSSCSSLTEITIPNSVTSIGQYAFAYCSGLTKITIPRSATIDYDAFYGCTAQRIYY